MAEKLNPEAGNPSEIESKAQKSTTSDFINGVHLKETKEAVANTHSEY